MKLPFSFGATPPDWSTVTCSPAPVFKDLASRVATESKGVTFDVGRLGQVLQELAKRCKEVVVKNALVWSDKHPGGLIYTATRLQIERVLPPEFQVKAIVDGLIKVGAWAARTPEVWDQVYPRVVSKDT